MHSIIEDTVFKEPRGGILALFYLAVALFFIGLYGYYAMIANSLTGTYVLFMCAVFGLIGIAESLPNHRRRAAGILRLASIFVSISLLAILVFHPDLVMQF
jgi:hypothetical protein